MHQLTIALTVGILLLTGCGDKQPSSTPTSGVTGTVYLGPQCPVEPVDEPCDDEPAAGVEVTVSQRLPGETHAAAEVVARGNTAADGSFRVSAPPGEYVVTAGAGMSCELMDVRVTAGAYTALDILCDTGIR